MENYVSAQSRDPNDVLSLFQEFCETVKLFETRIPPNAIECRTHCLKELTKTKY
jgi:hypothetical protein